MTDAEIIARWQCWQRHTVCPGWCECSTLENCTQYDTTIEMQEIAWSALDALTAAGRVIVDAGEWEAVQRHEQTLRDNGINGHSEAVATVLFARADLAAAHALLREAREGLDWYGENTRLCRLIHSEGDPGRHALDADGGTRARALATKIDALLPEEKPND